MKTIFWLVLVVIATPVWIKAKIDKKLGLIDDVITFKELFWGFKPHNHTFKKGKCTHKGCNTFTLKQN